MLYFRHIIVLLVNLYTVRIVLKVLGIEDYGIYNVVGGVIAMFSFVTGSLSAASQRFLAFELGRKDTEKFTLVFSQMILIYFFFALLILIVGETIGLWFVSNKLVIPDDRSGAALWVYQCAVISFFISMIGIPYTASLIAYENMSIFAFSGMIDVVLKLVIVFIIQIVNYDKLILYALLHIVIAIVNVLICYVYVKATYKACSFRMGWDNKLIRTLVSYLGWNMIGSIVNICKKHGVNIVLNLFSGPVVNGARALAYQISSVISAFPQNFTLGVRPQITKCYANGDYKQMYSIAFRGAKFSYFLMLLFSLPVLFEMEFLLSLWLKTVPQYTTVFTQLALITTLVEVISYPLITIAMATGNIRLYEIIIGIVGMGNIPLAYWILKSGGNPDLVFFVGIVIEILLLTARVCMLKYLVKMSISFFLKKVMFPIIFVSFSSLFASFFVRSFLYSVSIRGFILIPAIIIMVCIMTMFLGMDSIERKSIFLFLKKKLKIHA
jgi:O-antigen/teichoic acid export membrane protein